MNISAGSSVSAPGLGFSQIMKNLPIEQARQHALGFSTARQPFLTFKCFVKRVLIAKIHGKDQWTFRCCIVFAVSEADTHFTNPGIDQPGRQQIFHHYLLELIELAGCNVTLKQRVASDHLSSLDAGFESARYGEP